MALSFSLSAKPDTDIWKKPPSHDVFTAPSRPHSSGPLASFRSATITFTTNYTEQFDQAGILFTLTHATRPRRWIKSGIEHFNGTARLSTVCCDNWADWSIASPPNGDAIKAGKDSVTLLCERTEGADGLCLWIYSVSADGSKTPMREINWVFAEPEGWELEVGAAVARPGKDTTEELEVKFDGFEVKWEK